VREREVLEREKKKREREREKKKKATPCIHSTRGRGERERERERERDAQFFIGTHRFKLANTALEVGDESLELSDGRGETSVLDGEILGLICELEVLVAVVADDLRRPLGVLKPRAAPRALHCAHLDLVLMMR
jgi:hypothetical protein